jgi:hypothetical protein
MPATIQPDGDGYERSAAFAQVGAVMKAIEPLVAHTRSIADSGEFDEEPRALLETLEPMSKVLEVAEWAVLATEHEAAERAENTVWADFLARHSELHTGGNDDAS